MLHQIQPGEDITALALGLPTSQTTPRDVALAEAAELGVLYRRKIARDKATGLTRAEMRSRLLALRWCFGPAIETAAGIPFPL